MIYDVPQTSNVNFDAIGKFRKHEYEQDVSRPHCHRQDGGFGTLKQQDGLQKSVALVGPHDSHVHGQRRRATMRHQWKKLRLIPTAVASVLMIFAIQRLEDRAPQFLIVWMTSSVWNWLVATKYRINRLQSPPTVRCLFHHRHRVG